MRTCPKCNTQITDDSPFCTVCGTKLPAAAPQPPQGRPVPPPPPPQMNQPPMGYAPVPADPFDHTHEFNPRDISDHKAFVLLLYLLSIVPGFGFIIGMVLALLMRADSPYLAYHVRQYIKFFTAVFFFNIIALVTIIGSIALPVIIIVTFVLKIIGVVYACQGKAKELPIVRSLGFLK